MTLGTAGFTAALAIHRMEQLGQRPELGAVAVTGASGGVGSIAVSILRARGYEDGGGFGDGPSTTSTCGASARAR
jgi:NADPH2:quinone reductase